VYRCQVCGNTVGPRIPSNRLVVERRNVVHPRREQAIKIPHKRRKDWKTDPGGPGAQITREVTACADCVRRMADAGEASTPKV
jgi:hypothetical protein